MKLTILIILLSIFAATASSFSQETRFDIKYEDVTIKEVFNKISSNSKLQFFYSNDDFDVNKKVNLNAENATIDVILNQILDLEDLRYKVIDDAVIISKRNMSFEKEKNINEQQSKTINGKVTDSSSLPLPGVSIVIKGTSTGTISDSNGNFNLSNVPNDAILIFSFVGMQTQEIPVAGKTKIDIILSEDAIGIEEVVAIGYGTQKKVNLTGSVDVVSGETLDNRPASNVSLLLQGTSPNLNISMNKMGGEPGAEQNWQIRGIGSINGNDQPLILVDGVEMDINLVDPQSIESVSVLKDASASAVYGSRAAFGVVLVTTKKGKLGQAMQIEYSNNLSFAIPIYVPDMYDSYTYAVAMNQGSANAGISPKFPEEQVQRIKGYIDGTYTTPYDPNNPPSNIWRGRHMGNANVNWTREYWKKYSFHQKHNINLNGGGEKTQYYFNAGYLNQPGAQSWGDDGFKRYNILANIKSQISDWVSFSFNTKYARTETDLPLGVVGLPRTYAWSSFLQFFPTMPKYNLDGTYNNPLIPLYERGGREVIEEHDLWMNLGVELEPVKGWKTNIKYSYNQNWGSNEQTPKPVPVHVPNGTIGNIGNALSGYILRMSQSQYTLFSAYTSYEKSFNKHNFKILAGYEHDVASYKGLTGSKMELITEAVPSISTAVGDYNVDDYHGHWATQGIFGRFNYNYDEKYIVEFSARYDGSSRFAEGSRWGFFPSASAGYNIHKENFWSPISPYINRLKLRASYGELGNQNVDNYLYLSTIPISYNRGSNAFGGLDYLDPGYLINDEVSLRAGVPNLKSSNLTWETVTTLDVGLEAGFLNNRLDLVAAWYNRTTSDMVGPSEDLPSVLGTDAPSTNNAELSTKGFEISLGWKDRLSPDFSYNVNLSLADSKTTIKSYPNENKSIFMWYDGATYGDIWGYTSDGLIQTEGEAMPDQSLFYSTWGPGDMKYKDLDGDNIITNGENTVDNPGDQSVIANSQPRYYYGLSAGFSWKNFDFNMFWQGIGKAEIVPNVNSEFYWGMYRHASYTVLLKESNHLDYWRPADETNILGPNTDAFMPKPYYSTETEKNRRPQTKHVLNAKYFRLKNLQVGYTIPQHLLNKTLIKKARVYFSGENLLTFQKMPKVFEPETSVASHPDDADNDNTNDGVDLGQIYPITQMLSFGVTITF